MRTIEKTVYKFDELPEEGRQKAIENLHDINVDYQWWEYTFHDAERIGLVIKEFDIGRASYVNAEFKYTGKDCADKIIKEHGDMCDTHETAQWFLDEYSALQDKHKNDEDDYEFDEAVEEIEEEFLKMLSENYRILLRNEFEYLMSEEAIVETIQANEYEFYENGKLY